MTSPSIDLLPVIERLERVERELRWWKRLGLLVLVGFVGFFLMGQKPAKERIVEAEELRVVDASGRPRAAIGLSFLDVSGNPVAVAPTARAQKQPILWLSDERGTIRATATPNGITLLKPDTGNLNLLTADSLELMSRLGRAEIKVSSPAADPSAKELLPGGSTVTLETFSDPKSGVVISAEMDGRAFLSLNHPAPRATLSVESNGEPSLTLLDQSMKTRAVFGTAEVQTVKTGATTRLPESSLVLFDKDGKVIWQAP